MTCVAYSIYSTNGFRAAKRRADLTVLAPIECPQKDENVVIDISALITLHQLGLLDKSFEYFKAILDEFSDLFKYLIRCTNNVGIILSKTPDSG